jgi:hypothetical protein
VCARVRVGATTLDFADAETFATQHDAFQVDEDKLDEVLAPVKGADLAFYAGPPPQT